MFRISNATAAIVLLSASALVVAFGCQLVADIDEKQLPGSGGTGGAGTSSVAGPGGGPPGSTGSFGSGTSSSSGVPPPMCMDGDGPGPSSDCVGTSCPGNNPNTGCHCGVCGRECGDMNGCMAGLCAPKTLALVEGERIYRATVNGNAVFFPSFRDDMGVSSIRGANFDGTPFTAPIAQNTNGYVYVIASDCGRVYFATKKIGTMGQDALWHVPIMMGGVAMPIPLPKGGSVAGVESIAVDDSMVYWTDWGGLGVWKKETPQSVRIPAEAGFKGAGLAYDGQDLYWSEYSSTGKGHIHYGRISAEGVTPGDSFVEYDGAPGQLAVDATTIYWINSGSGAGTDTIKYLARADVVMSVPTPKTLTTADATNTLVDTIVADSSDPYVYYIQGNGSDETTYRITKPDVAPSSAIMAGQAFNEGWLVGDKKRIYLVTPKNNGTPEAGQIDWVAR